MFNKDDSFRADFNENIDSAMLAFPFKKYRVVLTCFDAGCSDGAYADCYEKLWDDLNDARDLAKELAEGECAGLNEECEPVEGCFEVDDCANNDFEVRWYEKKPEDRDEGSCDIEYVTTYNVYPVEFNGSSCKYRGFDVNSEEGNRHSVSKDGASFGVSESLFDALMLVDDVCLMCSKNKTCSLEAVHKVPLDVIIKFASDKQGSELSENHDVVRNTGERL